jgi:hypothetical protein
MPDAGLYSLHVASSTAATLDTEPELPLAHRLLHS